MHGEVSVLLFEISFILSDFVSTAAFLMFSKYNECLLFKLHSRARRSARKLSSSSSDSDGSELTVGGGSLDGDEPVMRKLSKSKAC